MILLKANSTVKTIFSKLITTMGENVKWTDLFVIKNNNVILAGKSRSLIFNFDNRRVFGNILDLPLDDTKAERMVQNPLFENALNLILYVFGKWGEIKGLKVEKNYDQLNKLINYILKEIDMEAALSKDTCRFYHNGIQITYEDVIQAILDKFKEEAGAEDSGDREGAGKNKEKGKKEETEKDKKENSRYKIGLWHNMRWVAGQFTFQKEELKKSEKEKLRLGNNFYIVNYLCPHCKEKLFMVVYPPGKELRIETNEAAVYMARAYTCSTCNIFYTPRPRTLIMEGEVYFLDLEDDREAYEDYLELLGRQGERTANSNFNRYASEYNRANQVTPSLLEAVCKNLDSMSLEELAELKDKMDSGFYPLQSVQKYEKKVKHRLKTRRFRFRKPKIKKNNQKIGLPGENQVQKKLKSISDPPYYNSKGKGQNRKESAADDFARKEPAQDDLARKDYVKDDFVREEPAKDDLARKDFAADDFVREEPPKDDFARKESAAGDIDRKEPDQKELFGEYSGKSTKSSPEFWKQKNAGIKERKNQLEGMEESPAKGKGTLKVSGRPEPERAAEEGEPGENGIKESTAVNKEKALLQKAVSGKDRSYMGVLQLIDEIEGEEYPQRVKKPVLESLNKLLTTKGEKELEEILVHIPEEISRKEYLGVAERMEEYREIDITPYKKRLEGKRDAAENREIGAYINKANANNRNSLFDLYNKLKEENFEERNVKPFLDKLHSRIYTMDRTALEAICPEPEKLLYQEGLKAYERVSTGDFLPELKINILGLIDKRLSGLKTDECKQLAAKLSKDLMGYRKEGTRIYFNDTGRMPGANSRDMGSRIIYNACNTYAALKKYEYPIAVCDTSLLKNGKEGFVLTPDHIFYNSLIHSGSIDLMGIEEVSTGKGMFQKGIYIKTKKEQVKLCNSIKGGNPDTLAGILTEYISYLKEKPDSRSISYLAKEKHTVKCCYRCGYVYKGGNVCPKCGSKNNE